MKMSIVFVLTVVAIVVLILLMPRSNGITSPKSTHPTGLIPTSDEDYKKIPTWKDR